MHWTLRFTNTIATLNYGDASPAHCVTQARQCSSCVRIGRRAIQVARRWSYYAIFSIEISSSLAHVSVSIRFLVVARAQQLLGVPN
jgi:hypothetical protein